MPRLVAVQLALSLGDGEVVEGGVVAEGWAAGADDLASAPDEHGAFAVVGQADRDGGAEQGE
jgi:hypothetical protein